MVRVIPAARPVIVEKAAPCADGYRADVPSQLLRRWNLLMALFHLSLGAATLALGNLDLSVATFTLQNRLEYRTPNGTWTAIRPDGAVDTERTWRLWPTPELDGEILFTLATASFFLISALFHAGNGLLWRRFYEEQLRQCRSPTRWAEYTITAPLMFALIAYGMGLRSRAELVATAALVSATIPYGAWGEDAARPKSALEWCQPLWRRALPWALGHIPQTVAWVLVILKYQDLDGKAPWFVDVILWSQFVLFYSFGGAVLVGLLLGPRSFWKQELGFQVLSLVSKGLLGALLLSNVLMLERFDDIY